MKLKFSYSLENFRGVAIVFVMLSHISSFQEMGTMGDYFRFFLADATAWFVFISGYLFCYLEIDKFKYGNYLYRKLKYVILPYLLLSIPAILIGLYYSRNVMYDLTPGMFTLWALLIGGAVVGPMWFIPMIAIFFILTPVFNVLSKSKTICLFAIVFLIFSVFSFRPIHSANALLSFLHFAGFYLLGIAAARYSAVLNAMSVSVKSVVIFISLLVFFISAIFYSGINSEPMGFFESLGTLNYMILGKLALLIAIFFIFERFFNVKNKLLGFLAKISFGLFFIHGFMMLVFVKSTQLINYPNSSLRLFSEIGIVVFLSIATVFVLRRILGKWSRYVLGC